MEFLEILPMLLIKNRVVVVQNAKQSPLVVVVASL
jgi:hypothetical protein